MPHFQLEIFSVVNGVSTLVKTEPLEAASDNAAVDAARKLHESDVPEVGGEFQIVVDALDQGVSEMVRDESGAYSPRAPGEISRFSTSHEPAPHVRDAVYAERAAAETAKQDAEKLAAMRAQVLAEVLAAVPQELRAQVAKAAESQEVAS